VRNLPVQDCTFEGTRHGLRISSPRGRGGVVENIRFSDITMKEVDPAITITCYDPRVPKDDPGQSMTPLTPFFRKIPFINIDATCTRDAGMIVILSESPISAVVLNHVRIGARAGLSIRNAASVQLNGTQIGAR